MTSPGQILGGVYRLDELLGRGRFASVYAATDTSKDERFALKIFNPDLALKSGGGLRFIRRARVAADQPHPAIVPILERKVTKEKIPYMVMELLEGRNLQQEVEINGALPLEKALRVMRAPMRALAAIHEGGTSHREINPSNIFLCSSDASSNPVRLMDYGVAWDLVEYLAVSPDVLGSTSYLAPEFLLNPSKAWTPAIDVFAIGMVFFYALTADLPFNKTDPIYGDVIKSIEVYSKGLYDLPGPSAFVPSIPPPIDDVVRKALSVNPKDRFLTAVEMLEALESASKINPAAFSSPSSQKEDRADGIPRSLPHHSPGRAPGERTTLRTSVKPNFDDFPLLLSEETEFTALPESSPDAKWLDWPTEIVKPDGTIRPNEGGTVKVPAFHAGEGQSQGDESSSTSAAADGGTPKLWLESSTVPFEKLAEDRTMLLSADSDPEVWDPSKLSDIPRRKEKEQSSRERPGQRTAKWKPRRAVEGDEESPADQSGELLRCDVEEETSVSELRDETYLLGGQDDETVMELGDGPVGSRELEEFDEPKGEFDTVRDDGFPPPDDPPDFDDEAPTLMRSGGSSSSVVTHAGRPTEPSFDTSAEEPFEASPSDPPSQPAEVDSPGSRVIRAVLMICVFFFFALVALVLVWTTAG